MRFPSLERIIELNRNHIETSGGFYVEPDNLKNAGSLEWVLEAIQYPLFGIDHYPTPAEKAAQLTWIITRGHVFHDGNKRTGMSALKIFLEWNGYRLDVTPDEMVDVALRVAGEYEKGWSLEEFVQWVRSKMRVTLIYGSFAQSELGRVEGFSHPNPDQPEPNRSSDPAKILARCTRM